MANLIALTGYRRSGKDEAAKALIAIGYERRCFGDIIKSQLDGLVIQHLGFSAFTEDDRHKSQIRHVMEHWGDANYDNIMREYFESLPQRAVNTRLVRVREAREWVARGGIVLEVYRPGYGPCSDFERDALSELRDFGLIRATIRNSGTIQDLHAAMLAQVKQ